MKHTLNSKVDALAKRIEETIVKAEDKDGKLEGKIDKIEDKMGAISELLIKNSTVLEEHQRRSLANEEAIGMMRVELDPIKRHVAMWGGVAKAGAAIGTVVGVIVGIVEIVKAFM